MQFRLGSLKCQPILLIAILQIHAKTKYVREKF